MPTPTPSIQSYFSSSPSKNFGDGFTAEEIANALTPSQPTWTPTEDYEDFDIGRIQPGPRFITFMGRIVNIYDSIRNTKSEKAAKGCLKITVGDDTGAITVGVWYAAAEYKVHLGQLVSVYTFHVSESESSSLAPSGTLYTSIFPERERKCHIMFHDHSDDGVIAKHPFECKDNKELPGLMTLKNFVDGGYDVDDCKIITCVKSIGARKKFTNKSGSTSELISVILFDDTADIQLTLYGAACHSATRWQPSQTILLISNPGWRVDRTVKISLNASTRLDVDPDLADARWLRSHAEQLTKREHTNPPFPAGVFDNAPTAAVQILYSFQEIDEWVRGNPDLTFSGWISAIITDLKIVDYHRRKRLMSVECCGIPIYANATKAECQQCKQTITLGINPRILGPLIDETGQIAQGKLIMSTTAWEELLGRTSQQLVEMDVDGLTYLEHRLMFLRLSWGFGYSPKIGRLCIWAVKP